MREKYLKPDRQVKQRHSVPETKKTRLKCYNTIAKIP